ncbi:PXP-18 [Backusella circina FSU 941]|nr:PXP-18 [Backusella circina FSU 941]
MIDNIQSSFNELNELSKEKLRSQVNGVFSFSIKNKQGEISVYVLDLTAISRLLLNQNAKPNVYFYMLDNDFVNLVQGKLNGQRAFMCGKLKIKGDMKLATKLDTIFKQLNGKCKL